MSYDKLHNIGACHDGNDEYGLFDSFDAVLYAFEDIGILTSQELHVIPIGKCDQHKYVSDQKEKRSVYTHLIRLQILICSE